MKCTITRLPEISRFLATEVGKAIPDFFTYMAEFIEVTVRSLRGGLTFTDNFDCQVKTVSLVHNTAQVISASKAATGIIPVRVISKTTGIDGFIWYYDDLEKLTVKASFVGSPTTATEVLLVILF
jgi:hypothetical protein